MEAEARSWTAAARFMDAARCFYASGRCRQPHDLSARTNESVAFGYLDITSRDSISVWLVEGFVHAQPPRILYDCCTSISSTNRKS